MAAHTTPRSTSGNFIEHHTSDIESSFDLPLLSEQRQLREALYFIRQLRYYSRKQ